MAAVSLPWSHEGFMSLVSQNAVEVEWLLSEARFERVKLNDLYQSTDTFRNVFISQRLFAVERITDIINYILLIILADRCDLGYRH